MESHRVLVSTVLICCALVSATRAVGSETVGPYTVEPAASARLIDVGDPGATETWITTSGQPATWDQAFSGPGIVAAGYANLPSGCTVESSFLPSTLVNRPGADLMLFEARFSAGAYAVDVWYSGDWKEQSVPSASFGYTSEDRSYYYGSPTHGPYSAKVYASPLDLSSFGVPLGASATLVRFRVAADGSDPLGFGAVVPEPSGLLSGVALALAIRRRRAG